MTPSGIVQQFVVASRDLGGGISPIREQNEAQVAVGIRQMMNLEPFDLFRHRVVRCQKCGHDDCRSQTRQHTAGKFEARQSDCLESIRGAAVHRRHGGLRRRDQSEQCQPK
jgi:hypothetical protein